MHLQEDIHKFLEDDIFLDWIKNPTPEKNSYWKEYFERHPAAQIAALQARRLIEMTLASDSDRRDFHAEIKTSLFQTINQLDQESIDEPEEQDNIRQIWHSNWLKVAAVAAMLIGVFWFYQKMNDIDNAYATNVKEMKKKAWQEVANTTTQPLLVVLPDQSTVVLSPKSKISYATAFEGERREVVLSGEAAFEIETNPEKPFLVHANELITKVLGTSFVVKAFPLDKKVIVKVRSGKVGVCTKSSQEAEQFSKDKHLEGLVLVKNESAEFNREESVLQKIVPQVAASYDEEAIFEFEDMPVSKAFDLIEKNYEIDIVVDKELIQNCTITASLGGRHLFDKLDIICQVIQARYEIIDGKIIVYAQKCKQ
jgi:ferric-dicitrate binding protein FerR (iron transport regulator)